MLAQMEDQPISVRNDDPCLSSQERHSAVMRGLWTSGPVTLHSSLLHATRLHITSTLKDPAWSNFQFYALVLTRRWWEAASPLDWF